MMELRSARATATGTLVSGRFSLTDFIIACGAAAGSVVFRDGGASGATLLTIDTPAGVGSTVIMNLSGRLIFNTDCHVTLTNATAITALGG